jgi:hypothetical protein
MRCRRPDHDNPRLKCGHLVPCPWHTIRVDLTKEPPTIEVPVTADPVPLEKLKEIVREIVDSFVVS